MESKHTFIRENNIILFDLLVRKKIKLTDAADESGISLQHVLRLIKQWTEDGLLYREVDKGVQYNPTKKGRVVHSILKTLEDLDGPNL